VKSRHGAGIGWHIQTWSESQSKLLSTVDKGNDYLSDSYTSEEAELLAIIRGVKECLQNGEDSYLKIRSDCKPLVRKVQDRTYITDDGRYMKALTSLLSHVKEWDIKWRKRDKNSVADRQAHYGLEQHA